MRHPLSVLCLLLLGLGGAGCDNVGRAFDPVVTPGDPNAPAGEVIVEEVPAGGDTREGRPKVRATFPSGGGWPLTVPVVVEFSESVNETSIRPTTENGTDGRIILRAQGSTQALPCQYDFLAGGRLLVLRPTPTLSNAQTPTYEVVLLPDARDSDGTRFQVPEEGTVLTEFQVNQDESFDDGRILMTFPRDNLRDATRETDYYAVFDRPANATSVTPANFRLRPRGGNPLAGDIEVPLRLVGVPDPRVVSFSPASALEASTRYEFVVDDTITFGTSGTLDFRGRTPFAVFDTIGPQAPIAVSLGNATAGYPDKINRDNVATARLDVTTPADAQPGDRIVARIYGGDAATTATGDLRFFERIVEVPAAGVQTVSVDFSGDLGSVASPRLDDGEVTFAVQMRRGSQQSGYFRNPSGAEPRFDVTPPVLQSVGAAAAGVTDLATDQEHVAFFGVANEEVAEATLTDGTTTVGLFASAGDGRLLMRPILLGRRSSPLPYSLLLTDTAGNLAAAAATGNILQRGVVTGTLAGTLEVEAYDDATLQPIAGATVLVDPGAPTAPATGQLVGTTDANGRASFAVAAGSHTVTIVRAGYDLVTLYDTAAAFVSLPLRPGTNATATFSGTLQFAQGAGVTALVGHSALDDARLLAIPTTSSAPTAIPETAIRPSRPQVITAFGGVVEPTASPTFSQLGYQMLGANLLVPTPPAAPATPGGTSRQSLLMIPSTGSVGTITTPYAVDFATATGLDTGNLVGGGPIVRTTMSLNGFGGQVLNGMGFATLSGASATVTPEYGLAAPLGFGAFVPSIWFATEARDTSGRISRHRALLSSFLGLPVALNQVGPPAVPVVTVPAGPFTGSPLVEIADVLDPAAATGGFAIVDVTATDSAGRRWRLLAADTDAVGGTTSLQLPDLSSNNVAGLATGTWSVLAEARLFVSFNLASAADMVLEDRRRQEVTYARSVGQDFTIQ